MTRALTTLAVVLILAALSAALLACGQEPTVPPTATTAPEPTAAPSATPPEPPTPTTPFQPLQPRRLRHTDNSCPAHPGTDGHARADSHPYPGGANGHA